MFYWLLFISALGLFWHFIPALDVLFLFSLVLRSRAVHLRTFKTNPQTKMMLLKI